MTALLGSLWWGPVGKGYSVIVLFEFKSCYFKNLNRKSGRCNARDLLLEVTPSKQLSDVSSSFLLLSPDLVWNFSCTEGKRNGAMLSFLRCNLKLYLSLQRKHHSVSTYSLGLLSHLVKFQFQEKRPQTWKQSKTSHLIVRDGVSKLARQDQRGMSLRRWSAGASRWDPLSRPWPREGEGRALPFTWHFPWGSIAPN